MTSIAEQLGQWICGSTLSGIPAQVRQEAKRCIVDVTGVAIAGSAHGTTQRVVALARAAARAGHSSIWGSTSARLAPAAAALANGTAAHVLDYDDTCYEGIVHGSAAVWPAVIACGEEVRANGTALLEAFIAGVETEYALGRALTERVYFKGWWTSGVLGAIGAAAGAAKVMKLDAAQTCCAISIAACQAGGLRAMIGTAAKPYALGRAAQAGVDAARFAHAGLDAPCDAFESERGFVTAFADGQFDAVSMALGERYALLEPGIAFKLYPACSATQAATEAVLILASEHRIRAEDVVAVECQVTPLVAISLVYDRPTSATEAQFSLPYAIACALAYRSFGVSQMNQPSYADPDVLTLMRKVTMVRNDALEATEEGRKQNPEGALVTITLANGWTVSAYNGASTGMPTKPMPEAALDAKFYACSHTVLGDAVSRRLLEKLRQIEDCTDARELMSGLAEQ